MSKQIYSIALVLAVLGVSAFEIQQVYAACLCMCRAQSGAPASVNVDVTGACDRDFSYTFKVHYATNDDSACSSGFGGGAVVYSNGAGSVNMNTHSISPDTFTVTGGGDTVTFTVEGDLLDQDENGTSKVNTGDNQYRCLEDTTVCIIRDCQCPTTCGSPPECE